MGYSLTTQKKVDVELTKFDFSANFLGMRTICSLLPTFGKLKNEDYQISSNDGYGIPWKNIYEVRDAILAESNILTDDGVLAFLIERDAKHGGRVGYGPNKDGTECTREQAAKEWRQRLVQYAKNLKSASEKAAKRNDFDKLELCFY